MIIRTVLHIVLVVLCVATATAQYVTPFAVKAGPPPLVRARILVSDDLGRPVRPSPSDVEVFENGSPVQNLTVSCPTSRTPRVASIAVSIDVSASMSRDIPPPAYQLAEQFTHALISAVEMPPSDMAIQVCDEIPLLRADYTTDKGLLTTVASSAIPKGGNDFVRHLLDADDGAIALASRGENERCIVLVTDAFWESLPRSTLDSAITLCLDNKVRFFAVILTERSQSQYGIVASFRELAERTGGSVLDGITTDSLARDVATTIAGAIDGIEPCDLTWTSSPACPSQAERTLTFAVRGIDTTSIVVPATQFEKKILRINPELVRFAAIQAGSSSQQTVRVTSVRGRFNVTRVQCSDPSVTVTPQSFTIDEGLGIDLTITYTSDGRTNVGARLLMSEPDCEWDILPVRIVRTPSLGVDALAITEPNGGEEFLAGSDSVITWSSGDTTRPVVVDVSVDAGATWTTVARDVYGTRAVWDVPRVTSDSCLARVTAVPQELPDSLIATGLECTAITVASSTDKPMRSTVAVATAHGVVVWLSDRMSDVLDIRLVHTDTITDLVSVYSRPQLVVTGCVDGTVAVIDSMRITRQLNHGAPVRAVSTLSNGSVAYSAGDDGIVLAWTLATGMQRTVTSVGMPIVAMRILEDTAILVTQDGAVWGVDVATGNTLWKRAGDVVKGRCIDVSETRKLIALGCADGSVMVLGSDGATVSPSIAGPTTSPIRSVAFSSVVTQEPVLYAINETGVAHNVVPITSQFLPLLRQGRRARCVAQGYGVVVGWSGGLSSSFGGVDARTPILVDEFDEIATARLNRTGTTLYTVSKGGLVWTWDVLSGKPASVMRTAKSIVTPVISPRGRYLLVAPDLSTILCYDLADPNSAPSSTTVGTGISVLRFDPGSDERAGIASTLGVTLLDVPSLFTRNTYTATYGSLLDFAWNAEATQIAVAENDADRVVMYSIDAITGAPSPVLIVESGIAEPRATLTWLPSSDRYVVAATTTLMVAQLPLNTVIHQLPLTEPATDLSVSPDGSRIVVVAPDAADPIHVFTSSPLAYQGSIGGDLGPLYQPTRGRYALGSNAHATTSRFGAGIVRNLAGTKLANVVDVSDTLFSIVWPRLTARDVDMGRVRVGSRKDSTVEALVSNRTRFTISADSVVVTGAHRADFTVTLANLPGLYPPRLTSHAEVVFVPAAKGLRSAQCMVFCGTDTTIIALSGIGVEPTLALETASVDVGVHLVGSVFDSTVVVVRCIADTAVTITHACLEDAPFMPFTVVGGASPLCEPQVQLNPQESLSTTFRFTPTKIGRSSTVFNVESADGLGRYPVIVRGIGLGPSVRVRSDSGFPGDRRPIVLELANASSILKGATALPFEARLRFDRTVLVPQSQVVESDGTLLLRGLWSGLDSTVVSIPARVALGMADSTTVELRSFTWFNEQGVPVDGKLQLEDGVFRVLGVCEDGKPRLFNPNSSAPSLRVSVAGEQLIVDLPRSSTNTGTITMLDLQGRELVYVVVPAGKDHVVVNIANLARGSYIVRYANDALSAASLIVR